MKILKFEAENVKRLGVVEITPQGNVVIVGGKNGAGKTSCLDAIEYALAGKRSIPDRPLRDGEEHGHVVCELDDLVVRRTFTAAGGGQLVVANKDGARYQTPQAILDKLAGTLTFDPLEFCRMDRKRQLETLRALVGIDLSQLNVQRQAVYDERAEVNRKIERRRIELEGMPEPDPTLPDEEVATSVLLKELETAEALDRAAQEVEREARDAATRRDELHADFIRLHAAAEEAARKWGESVDEADRLRATASEASSGLQDLEAIRGRLRSVDETNAAVREKRHRAAVERDLATATSEAAGLTKTLAEIDRNKARMISEAAMPVRGLSFDEAGVTFKGLPFDQAASSEQLRVSIAMGIALNPKLRILLIRDASLLDEHGLELVADMAERHDMQVWLERVGEGKECTVVIEDGRIKT